MTLPALYKISDEYLALARQLEEMDLDETTIIDTLEASGLEDDFKQKATSIEIMARNMEAFIPAIDAEIERLNSLKRKRKLKSEWLRAYIQRNMQACGIQRIQAPFFDISLRNNPQSVEIYDEALIPQKFMRTFEPPAPRPDKEAIKKALKADEEVQGARLTTGVRVVVS